MIESVKSFVKTKFDYIWLAIGLLCQFFGIWYGYHTGAPDSAVIIVSGIAGVFSVILCAQGKFSFYVFGFIQLFTYVFGFTLPNALHGETIENVMYFVTMLYGMYVWKNCTTRISKPVTAKKLGWKGNTITATIFCLGTALYGYILATIPFFGKLDSDPWLDAASSVPAYIAQFFLVTCYREQWIYWLILDILSVALAIRAGSYVMAAQFVFWSANCIYGWVKWTRLSSAADT